jgi:rubrerythrin
MKKFGCTVCGYMHEGESPPAVCPDCGAPAEEFREIA